MQVHKTDGTSEIVSVESISLHEVEIAQIVLGTGLVSGVIEDAIQSAAMSFVQSEWSPADAQRNYERIRGIYMLRDRVFQTLKDKLNISDEVVGDEAEITEF